MSYVFVFRERPYFQYFYESLIRSTNLLQIDELANSTRLSLYIPRSSLDFRMRGYPSTETDPTANYETTRYSRVVEEDEERYLFLSVILSLSLTAASPPPCFPFLRLFVCLPPSVEIHRVYDAVSPPSSLERTWLLFRLSPVGSTRLVAICLSPRLSFSFSPGRVAPRDLHRDSCPAANL